MARILLGVTGSVAASRTPALRTALDAQGHDVRIVATEASLYFFPAGDVAPSPLYRDRDEWPGDAYRRGDPVLHIELRKWADLLLVAPLDAHTLAKLAIGLSDNLLTCILRAWDFERPVALAPAMNTLMWRSPVTRRHLQQLLEDRGDGRGGVVSTVDDAAEVFARHAPRITLIPPILKVLACGDEGSGAMAEVPQIVASVASILGRAAES